MLKMCKECVKQGEEECGKYWKCERFKNLMCELKIHQIRLSEYEDFEKRWEEVREIWKELHKKGELMQ